jgi:hypothetical protein
MWGMVTMIPDEALTLQYNLTPGPFATDEGTVNMRSTYTDMRGLSFAYGLITPNDNFINDIWVAYYKVIRIANIILMRMGEVPDMTPADRDRIEAYTRFFRAYAYYNLLVNFGPPILLGDEIVNNNEDITYYDRTRSTYDEAIAYICAEFEKAALNMPAKQSVMDFGKPTKGAALALSARLRLMHASPAFNGDDVARRYFSNWLRKTDNIPYVSLSYDEKRWAVAAAAAQQLIEMKNEGRDMYSLYTVDADDATHKLPAVTSDPNFNTKNFPEGALGIDHFKSYAELFNGEAPAANITEYIWARRSNEVKENWGRFSMPVKCGGNGRFAVTQKVVDAYRMDDGRTIAEASSDGYYTERGYLGTNITFSGYSLRASVSNMYVNREMRFYASIGFNQAFWECASVTETPAPDGSSVKNHIANYYNGGIDGKGATTNELQQSITGYVIKKWINPMDAFSGSGARRADKVYPIIRYAEILLSYAEALNNLTTGHQVEVNGQSRTYSRNTEEIQKAFNQVRYRAGLPGINVAGLDRNSVQALIERERMVEFLFENRRYFDVRRWGIYEETENEPVQGMNVFAEEINRDNFYQRTNVVAYGARMVDRKLMFLPLPRAELRRMPSLDQNPGWN